jgi:hypothetical protein
MAANVLSDTLSLTAPRSTAAELRFCSTCYQVCLNFQLELELELEVVTLAFLNDSRLSTSRTQPTSNSG